MRQEELKIDIDTPGTEWSLLDDEQYIFAQFSAIPEPKPVFFKLYTNEANKLEGPSNVKRFIRLNRDHYDNLKLHAHCAKSEKAEGIVYLGKWSEILIMDLFYTLNFYLQSYDEVEKEYIIGKKGSTHLIIKKLNYGEYHLKRVLYSGNYNAITTTEDTILNDSPVIQFLEGLIAKIEKNTKNPAYIVNMKNNHAEALDNTHEFLKHY